MSINASSRSRRRWRIGLVAACAALFAAAVAAETARAELPERPNIVLIMADDMGYSDLGCYGGEIQTPHLDQLAENGLRFTQFYNAGRCCPTRASLLTGLYPHQAGVGHMVSPGDEPGYRGRLTERCVTMAELLGGAGYQTFVSGKWHVTHYAYADPEPTLHPASWPLARGFDRFFGHLSGGGSYWDMVSLMKGDRFVAAHEGGIASPLIAHWPAGIRDAGALRHQVGHVKDLLATCLELAAVPYPHAYRGRDIVPLEGTSLLPALRGEPQERPAIFWEHEGHRAVRCGKWKLVAERGGPWELYDLEADRTERNDLAPRHPERVERMATMWDEWADRALVRR